MRRLSFTRCALFLLALAGLARAADGKKPNVLFIFADDLTYEAIGASGLEDVDTPNLDRLAASGAVFSHAYNMGSWSGAVCVASRTMLVTGRTVWRAHAIHNKTAAEMKAGRLWPQMMKGAGYDTYFTGKWHVQCDAAKSFDTARNIRGGMPKSGDDAYNRPLPGAPDTWSPHDVSRGGFWTGGKHWSEVVRDDALDFLAAAKKSERPFFMYVAFNAAHDPRQSPKQYIERYPLDRVKLPASFLPLYPHREAIGCGPALRDEKLAPFPRTEHAVKVHRREYFALITHMDAQIGAILDALEKNGQRDNTWIIFTADHGLAVGHHGLFGKQNMYDHSIRVPFIIAGPGVEKGRAIPAPIYLQDAMATALDLAGAEKPPQVEFRSLLPVLRGGAKTVRDEPVYSSYLQLQRAVVDDGWKLILYPKAKVARLYHLAEDPREMKDLAADAPHAARKAALFQKLLKLQRELDDTLDLRAAFPEL